MASPWNFHTAFSILVNQDQIKDGLSRKWEFCQMFALVLECLLCVFTYCFKRTMVVFHYLGMETAVLVKCYKNLFRVVVNVTCSMSFLSRL
jgi:hypothetical protein